MDINYQKLSQELSEKDLIEMTLEAHDPKQRSLVSGAHQLLLPDGRISTFGEFAKITGKLAAQTHEILDLNLKPKLFLQVNDQLAFQGLSSGVAPRTGLDFWENPWEEIEYEGHRPEWREENLLAEGLDIVGQPSPGLISEWRLQRWHITTGLKSLRRLRRLHGEAHRLINSNLSSEELVGIHCSANGCANEIMVEAPFCVERGFTQLIGYWPLACKGPVLFGSTVAALAMEADMKGPEGRSNSIHFKGPFRYVHVFLNSYGEPQTLRDLLKCASICTISTNP